MTTDHDRLRLDLGAYLIGSLAPAERSALDRHLAGCAGCRAEVATLAPLPGLLGRLDAEDARAGGLAPGADLLPRTLDAVRARQRRERRRLRGWRALAVVAGVVAVLALVAPMVAAGRAETPLTAGAGGTASGEGVLEGRAWGTAVALNLSGLPPASGYLAYAVARDGRGEVAASWGQTADGHVSVTGATAIPRADIASVQIRTTDGRAVLTLPG